MAGMSDPGKGPRFLTLTDVAEVLNTSSAQVYALVRRGDLAAIKIGGRGQWRVEASELEAYIQRMYAEARTFIDEFNRQDNRQVRGIAPETEKELERYSWPGNVRELRNVIQRAVVLSGTGLITNEHLPDNVLRSVTPAASVPAASVTPIREMERDLILRALEETNQDKRKAAQLLGISLKTLYNKLAKYGIQAVKSARLT